MQKETTPLISMTHIVYFEFLLYNVLHDVGDIYWQMFFKEWFLLQLPENYIYWS